MKSLFLYVCLGMIIGSAQVTFAQWNRQELLTQDNPGSGEGYAVALSADGNTLAAAATYFGNFTGAIQVYTRSGTTWESQAFLKAGFHYWEGFSVSLSADGNTLAIGAVQGAQTYVYTRSGTTWQLQADLNQGGFNTSEGYSVSLSADGTTLAVGAPYLGGFAGVTIIYTGSGATWQLQTTLTQGEKSSWEGSSVSLSADGNTLAASAPYFGGFSGATQIYTRSGATWKYQATLTHGDESSWEGFSVSLSADGNTLAAGAPYSRVGGQIQIYTRSANTWTWQQTLTQSLPHTHEGYSVALSADGNTLAAGAPYAGVGGETHIYAANGTKWAYVTTLTSGKSLADEGRSVALSNRLHGNGTTLAAGAPSYLNSQGMTSVYVNP